MRRRKPRTRLPKAERTLLAALVVLLGCAGPALGGEERASRLRIEFGVDAYQRTYYRPSFQFVSKAPPVGGTAVFFDLAYLQRANGRLEGPIDFWLDGGLEKRLSKSVSLGASLTHFCRHVTSRSNPYILNHNEAVGRVAWTAGAFRLGFGAGAFVGGSPGLSRLVVLGLDIDRLVLQELSFESEIKWTDFSGIYHEAGLALALGPGVDLVLRSSRTYGLPAEAFVGARFASDGTGQNLVDRFGASFGLTPFHGDFKLVAAGGFRLVLARPGGRRLLVDVGFDAPILDGGRFLGKFWPDRMIYVFDAQYEVGGRGLFAAWYARYVLDMPADRAAPFAGRLGTGLVVRNQADFETLAAPLRVEAFAGIDFGRALDFGFRAGVNTVEGKPFDVGLELDWKRAGGRPAYEIKAFAAAGKEVSIRPFVGVRRLGLYSMNPPPDEPVRQEWMFGVSLLKWY